jgi:hypothetical protein
LAILGSCARLIAITRSTRGVTSRVRASLYPRVGAPGPTLKCSVVICEARTRRAIKWPTMCAFGLCVTTRCGLNVRRRNALRRPPRSLRRRIRAHVTGIPCDRSSSKNRPSSRSVRTETSKPRSRRCGIRTDHWRSKPPVLSAEHTNSVRGRVCMCQLYVTECDTRLAEYQTDVCSWRRGGVSSAPARVLRCWLYTA